MNIKEALSKSKFDRDGVTLLSAIIRKDKSFIYAHPEYRLSQSELEVWENKVRDLNLGKPISYLVNEQEFYGRRFYVNEDVLIPRPETEEIVDLSLQHAKDTEMSILELGVGSGAILITFVIELNKRKFQVEGIGVDISNEALSVAIKNAKLHGVQDQIQFRQGGLFEPVGGRKFDLILANLPYLPTVEAKRNQFEPQLALDGGEDGQECNRRMLADYQDYLNPGGLLIYEDYGGKIIVIR